jgi:16S rRNA processing protein RimM
MPGPPNTGGPELLVVGRVTAPHGIRGEVKIEPLTDFPERFEPGSKLTVRGLPLSVERARWQRRSVIVKLSGIDDRNAAESLRGAEVEARAGILEPGVYYRDDVIGLEVFDEGQAKLGRITEILSTGANDVYVVHGPQGELLLPATDDVVKAIDMDRRRIVVEVIDGLEWQRKPGGLRRSL